MGAGSERNLILPDDAEPQPLDAKAWSAISPDTSVLTRKATSAPEAGFRYDGVKLFSATMFARREKLGDEITSWLGAHPERAPVSTVVLLSSDAAFH